MENKMSGAGRGAGRRVAPGPTEAVQHDFRWTVPNPRKEQEMTGNNGSNIHVVTTWRDGRDRLLAAFSQRADAQAYADLLDQGDLPKIHQVTLDEDYNGNIMTVVDLDRDGDNQGVQARVMPTPSITNAFFQGEKRMAAGADHGAPRLTYENIMLRLEAGTHDQEAALKHAQRVHEKITEAGLWPPEGCASFGENRRQSLDDIVRETAPAE